MNQMKPPECGLYRHFKGDYYIVDSIATSVTASTSYLEVVYHNVECPDKIFTRDIADWNALVNEREDNSTGQYFRFEKVWSTTSTVKDFSTEALLQELVKRKDSPLSAMDIVNYNKAIEMVEYFAIYDVRCEDGKLNLGNSPVYFDTREECERHIISTCKPNGKTKTMFKNIILRVEQDG